MRPAPKTKFVSSLLVPACFLLLLGGCAGGEVASLADTATDQVDSEVIVSDITEGDYVLRSAATGKCLDVAGASVSNGAVVQEWGCNGTSAQRFHIAPIGGGFFKITNTRSGKSLDIINVSTAQNAKLQQWDYVGGQNQQFQFVSRGNDEFSINVRLTNMVLDLYWGNAADGTPVVQYPYIGGANQRWKFDKVDTLDGDYVLHSAATGKCLDVAGASTANGVAVQEWTCNGTGAQRFHISSLGGGFSKIINTNSGRSLDIPGASTAQNVRFQQWDYLGGQNQQFQFVPRGSNEFSIQVRHTGMVLDLYWGNAADGTAIVQYPYIGGANQRWTLEKVSSSGGGPIGTPPSANRNLTIINRCSQPIWVAHSQNVQAQQNVRLETGQAFVYDVPVAGLAATRFWPKTGCDANGLNCQTGDSAGPCPATGCQPPIESKFEATFAARGSAAQTWYNLSQVDGYTLPFKVTPTGAGAQQGSCVTSDCSGLRLDRCPGSEDMSGGGAYPVYAHEDLRVWDNAGHVIGCMAPCKKWNYPAPWGLGQPESADPGLHLCCPTPIDPASGQCTAANACMTSDSCRSGGDPRSVTHTQYVQVMHQMCPTAYSFAYDDAAGLHACSSETSFEVVFCP